MTPFARLERETASGRDYLFSAPVLQDVAAGRFDIHTYLRFLGNAYQHVKHTVPLMMACGSRLPERLRWLQPLLRSYIDEEIGHEQWVLDDIAACGVDAGAMVAAGPGREVELLVSYVYDYINRHNPVGFFGMVYVLEGTSVRLATGTAAIAQAKLGLPDTAFRYLRSHGALDQDHLVFFRNLIDRLTEPGDLDAVVHVADRVYHLYGDVIRAARGEVTAHAA